MSGIWEKSNLVNTPSFTLSECSTVVADEHSARSCHEEKDVEIVLSPHCHDCSLVECAVNKVHSGGFEVGRDDIEMGKKIGEGEFGIVFKGQCQGRPCAIKRLKHSFRRDSQEVQRLLIELTVLASLPSHPNVVGLMGACIADLSYPLIILELVEGENLEDHLSPKPIGFNLGRPKVRHPCIIPGTQSALKTKLYLH
jgi:hypothetical protein